MENNKNMNETESNETLENAVEKYTVTIKNKDVINQSFFSISAIQNYNLGKPAFLFSMSLLELYEKSYVPNEAAYENPEIPEISSEDKIAQRPLLLGHARNIAFYFLTAAMRHTVDQWKDPNAQKFIRSQISDFFDSLIDSQNPVYAVAPIVAHLKKDFDAISIQEIFKKNHDIQNELPFVFDKISYSFVLRIQNPFKLEILDGQHRLKALNNLYAWVKKVIEGRSYPTDKDSFWPSNLHHKSQLLDSRMVSYWTEVENTLMEYFEVPVLMHIDLQDMDRRQLFSDLNSKGKTLSQSDQDHNDVGDPLRNFRTSYLWDDNNQSNILKCKPVISDFTNWESDMGNLTVKDIDQISAYFLTGKSQKISVTPKILDDKKNDLIEFWKSLMAIPNIMSKNAKQKTIAQQAPVLKGLALLGNQLSFGEGKTGKSNQKEYRLFLDHLQRKKIDFSHTSKLWHNMIYIGNVNEGKLPKSLREDYLFVKPGTNLQLADLIPNTKGINELRFSNRTNEIVQRIGDTLRYHLKLTAREYVRKMHAKNK